MSDPRNLGFRNRVIKAPGDCVNSLEGIQEVCKVFMEDGKCLLFLDPFRRILVNPEVLHPESTGVPEERDDKLTPPCRLGPDVAVGQAVAAMNSCLSSLPLLTHIPNRAQFLGFWLWTLPLLAQPPNIWPLWESYRPDNMAPWTISSPG